MSSSFHSNGGRLRALTFLAPSIPQELFEIVTEHLARSLSCSVSLETESRSSGPMHGAVDPFAEARADIGFLCSPSYLYLRAQPRPSVDLVPAAFVFHDPRNQGTPVYFSDVVVRAEHPARSFLDLAGGVWGFNDECSLSGYFATLQKLSQMGSDAAFFGRFVRTGSHLASIEALLSGAIDGAAIDSTVLAIVSRARPELARRLRVVDSWGPFPIQPIVVRSVPGSTLGARVAEALLELGKAKNAGALARFGLERCAPIDDSAYAEERRALGELGASGVLSESTET